MEANRPTEIVWDEKAQRFETEDKEAFLQYQINDILLAAPGEDGEQEKAKKLPAVAMDMVHTYVPRSKRGLGLAARLCDAAFAHAQRHSMLVVPTCSYISETYLPRNPAWNSLLYNGELHSSM
ncbi:acetyltransferase At1g77540-like [Zingiber officinale]|uniref:N-acetyltransferase domain-containing protein n=1 Tax=Zingiber officinale TaxID=94328 RepID=A0A8J5LZQ7_ZINOF|nr:acetyltransferase At1g77540-like [Zingiber officinale]KAG6529277.1 hypothetical protein ZIOFF_011474 [Zingiber officinale]